MKNKFKKLNKERDEEIVFNIDEDNVKAEWTRQAGLFQEYSVKTIKAVKIKNKLNFTLDVAIAELDKKIRDKPSKYFSKGGKITELGIKNIIEFDEDIGKIKEELIEKEYQANLYSGVLKSLEHRKKALEFFGQIYLASLYSEPKEASISDVKIRNLINKKRKEKGGEED